MTDKQMNKELTKFANEHTLAENIIVTVDCMGKRFNSKEDGAKYEDVILLADIVRGAEHYLMWKRRKNKKKR